MDNKNTVKTKETKEISLKDEKGGSIDLQAELNDGILVNVELQVKKKESFENRTVFYGSKMIARETKRRNRV